MNADIFVIKEKNFVLWRGRHTIPLPRLIIGELQLGAPISFVRKREFDLQQAPNFPDLWLIPAQSCNLTNDKVYHYWFETSDTHPKRPGKRIRVTDPFAFTVDWRLTGPRPDAPEYTGDDEYPAAVVKFSESRLIPCDAGGETGNLQNDTSLSTLPPNNRLVLYELPTAWTRIGSAGEREIGLGAFRDIVALIDPNEGGANFSDLEITRPGRSYLTELGINALELLPPADSFYVRQWGYGTTNFCAPDFELGFPYDYSWPTPNRDLRTVVTTCHAHGVRFFIDVVMAFLERMPIWLLPQRSSLFSILEPIPRTRTHITHGERMTTTFEMGLAVHYLDTHVR
jgi:pullulanase